MQTDLQGPAKTEQSSGTTELSAAQQPPDEFEEKKEDAIADPLEPWNRAMFTFNDRLYFWLMKPVLKQYNRFVPEKARQSARNFFYNLAMPIRFASSILQADMKAAGIELLRFSINATIGFFGFFDVAKTNFKIEPQKKDIGQTLGKYGIGEGFYIVWPFVGPSSVRDTISTASDIYLEPWRYVHPWEAAAGIGGYDYFNKASLESSEYEELVNAAVEPYTALKNAYIQYRRNIVKEK